MTYDPQNIFARILRCEIPAKPLFENAYAMAFADIRPQAPVHVLVIPKGAYVSLADFSSHASGAEQSGFFAAIAAIIEQYNLEAQGFRAIANCGQHGGQEVPHFHMHIIGGRALGPMLPEAN